MSREIDTSDLNALSEDDIQYLKDRGRLPADFEAAEDDDRTEDVGYGSMSKAELRALAEERGLTVDEDAKKRDIIRALEKEGDETR